MKKAIKVIVWLVAIAGAAGGLVRYYQYMRAEEQPADRTESDRPESAPLVRASEVGIGTLEQRVFVTGTVEPESSAKVMPEVSGVLEKFRLPDGTPVEEGLEVNAGVLIGVVEHEDLKAALEEAKANLRVAQSSLAEARVQLEDARREKERMIALYEEGTTTEQQRDKALTAYETARARVQLGQKRVEHAKASLERARVRYEDATIEAPISGIVSQKYVDEDSHVNPSSPLLKIINIEHVEVQGAVAGKYFSVLRPGQTPARVQVDAYPETEFPGTVDRVQPELDPRTRTAKVTIRIRNPEQQLKPGMFARMELVVRRRENVPVVPEVALKQSNDHYAAFVVNGGKAHARAVRIGMQEENMNEVLEGLSPGERVVTRGHHLLKDGMEVRVEEGEE